MLAVRVDYIDQNFGLVTGLIGGGGDRYPFKYSQVVLLHSQLFTGRCYIAGILENAL